jgi:galactonate dehydratase
MEHVEDDVPQRYEVVTPLPEIVDGHITVPDRPGLGVDIVEEVVERHPSRGNVSRPNPEEEYVYFRARRERASWANQ